MRIFAALLLIFNPISFTYGQSTRPCYEKVYQVSDTLPILLSQKENILKVIKTQIVIPDSLKNHKGHLLIKYVINCTGDVVNLKVVRTADSDGNLFENKFAFLSPQIIRILREELKWRPARQGGKAVDFLQICSITFDKGEIYISLTAS
jgi:hypothetical protein